MPRHEPTGIHWIEHGTGLPVVMLHGLMGDHRLISRFTESVLEPRSGLRRLHLDLPGHGRSSGEGVASSDDVADRVATFLDDVLGAETYAVVGNSFGGGIARALTAREPSRVLGMALIAPMIIADHARRDVPTLVPADIEPLDGGTDEDRRDFAEFTFRQTRQHWDLYLEEVVPGTRLADMDAIGRISAAYEFSVRPESRFTTYDRPVTFILGRQDPVVGYADALALAAAYPRATYLVADGAGHNPHHEQSELSAAALAAWIDAVLSSTA
jgi:pimeloyl-ACP methyl ester carboxylesterase